MDTSVKQKIIQAYKMLLKHDLPLLKRGVNERSITHKFAEHLQKEFTDYDVDCEYNKTGLRKKSLIGLLNQFKELAPLDDKKARTVFPDIIVHHRGRLGRKNNLLVIEAKKDVKNDRRDEFKLEQYKKQLKYQNACFLTFPTGKKANALKEEQIAGFITPR